MKKWQSTKPRIAKEIKEPIMEYCKTHSIRSASIKFGVAYNTINFWVNPKYREYIIEKGKENVDKINENSKKYNKRRRELDSSYVARRNEDTKKWQKEKRKKDKEWRDNCKAIAKKYYEEHKHEEFMKANWRKQERKRRARKLNVNESYNSIDEKYTRDLFNNTCVKCGTTENLCIDHWKPLSKGYALTRENAVVLCRKCNRQKSNNMPEDYFPSKFVEKVENILNNK